MRHIVVSCIISLCCAAPALADPVRIDIQDVPTSVKAICLGAHRENCTPSSLPDAHWVLRHAGQEIAVECRIDLHTRGDDLRSIGCGIPWYDAGRAPRLAFALDELTAQTIAEFRARCLDARAFSNDGLIEDNLDWARRATEHRSQVDRQCMAEVTGVLGAHRRAGTSTTVAIVLHNPRIVWTAAAQ